MAAMNFTALLDVAIGLTLVFLGTSLFVTIINEFIAQWLNLREKQLAHALNRLLGSNGIQAALQSSMLIGDRMPTGDKHQSYVDPTMLARALIGVTLQGKASATVAEVTASINSLADSKIKQLLLELSASIGSDVANLEKNLAEWINSSLEQLGEFYKRRAQLITFGIGCFLAVVFNIDTIEMTQRLYRDNVLRTQLADYAEGFVARIGTDNEVLKRCTAAAEAGKKPPLDEPNCAPIKALVNAIQDGKGTLQLPIGWNADASQKFTWSGFPKAICVWLLAGIGWLATGLAVSLGAPFWFDLLKNFVSIRHSMRKPKLPEPTKS
jgi:hypothetical protein